MQLLPGLVRHGLSLLTILAVYLTLSSRLLLIDPPVHPDETYFLDSAVSLQQSGYLKTQLYGPTGLSNAQIRNYHYPPLYPELLRFWFKLTNYDIGQLRLLSVIFGGICIVLWYGVMYTVSKKWLHSILSSGVLLFYGPFGISSRVLRMEIIIITLIATSILIIVQQRKTTISLLSLGCLVALLPLFHVAGLVACLLLLIWAYFHLQLKMHTFLRLLVLPVLIGIAYWLFRYSDRLDLLFQQLLLQVQYKAGRISLITQLFSTQPIWRITIISLLITSGVSLIIGWYYDQKRLVISGVGIMITFLVIWYGKEQWYLVYLIFPLLLLLAQLKASRQQSLRLISTVVITVLLITFSNQQYSFLQATRTKVTDYHQLVTAISRSLPNKSVSILVSSLPDPTIGLWQKGYTTIHAVPHLSRPNEITSFIKNHDYLIVNFATNAEFRQILEKSQWQTLPIQGGAYEVQLIDLTTPLTH
jgi:hypothetical protein